MSRTVWLIPLGAIAGSAAVLVNSAMQAPQEAVPDTAIGTIELTRDDAPAGGPIAARGAFAAGLQAHEAAASSNNLVTLRQMIENLAGQPGSVQRDSQIHGLLAQFASIDAWEAARLAERLQLGADALATVYRIWADTNSEEALFELSGLWPPATQRAVALAMLDVFGANSAGVEQIAAAFPEAEATSFRIDAIGEVARTDPDEAMAMADSILVSATQTIAQQRIATVMAGSDPQQALEYGATIKIAIMRQRFMDQLLDSWAQLDPDGMFSYMETADLTQMTVSPNSFRALATINPEKLLGLAEKFAPAQRENAQIAALQALASMDPISAYNRVSTLPASASRDEFINNIARVYAGESPDNALAWVNALEPPSPVAFQAVLSTVAAEQPVRVADAVIADILNPASANRAMTPSIAALLSEAIRAGSPEIAQVADRLASHRDPRVRLQLSQLVQLWPQADPETAMTWVMRNPSHLSANNAMQFSQLLANQNPALAQQSLQRVPEDLQSTWIQGTASGMGRNNLEGTIDWLDNFRDQPVYDQAMGNALSAAASNNPGEVAAFVEQSPRFLAQVAPTLAANWSARDPAAAADWIGSLSPEQLASVGSATNNVVSNWSRVDANAARSWSLGLPAGTTRDNALSGLLQAQANEGNIDADIIEQFSSPEARSSAVMSSLFTLGRQDPDAARQLVDEYVTEPGMRTQAEQMIESASQMSGASGLPLELLLRTGAAQSGSTCIQLINGNPVVTQC